jgi:group I intron endonuclease
MIGYVYKITSPSGKVYIGQTTNLNRRMSSYKGGFCKQQPRLYNSILKYGWENHKVEILEGLAYDDIQSDLDELEIYWIKQYDSTGSEDLNCDLGGRKGNKISEETRRKISEAKKGKGVGRKHSPETIAKLKEKAKARGNNMTNGWTEARREAEKNVVRKGPTPEVIEAARQANLKRTYQKRTKNIMN